MKKTLSLLLLILLIASFKPKSKSCHKNSELEFRPPLMGWASWNNYRVNINEKIIKSQADAMVNLNLKDAGYTFINIDDGYFGGRNANGEIQSHEERFPCGMKNIADYIHSKGLNAGIYSDAGINTCASYYDKDTIGVGMGLYGHDEQDLQLFLKEWDFDFIKVDWCGGNWLGLDEQTRYTEIGQIARKIKPSVIYNVCRWQFPGKWVTQVADSWRISGDISNKFESILKIIDLNADLWRYCSCGHYNDMDMLQVGRGMTYEEDKTHFTMWCIMHSPLLLGNDLTQMSEQTRGVITNEDIIALNQSKFVYQARRLADHGELEVWGKPVDSTMSGEVAVALLNRTNETQSITFRLESVGIDSAKGYTAKDLWSKAISEISNNSEISKEVPPHGVVVLKIKGKSLPYNVFQYDDKK
ncbi:MAG: alpha-galactosidase [Bacteroidetes bacterium GWF2_42_66]|nr:MAG: alpha-galactosidase [Bacteroidetes bacterium GWA2_42_15]OFY00822.1 MAG: alpha-galactosidase [Bacteroidetes bacterium GWE2_42_39]OFY40848.1 MAG: alpha-galactosidase [Bacteroidetes bacterium GWF2_42_66]